MDEKLTNQEKIVLLNVEKILANSLIYFIEHFNNNDDDDKLKTDIKTFKKCIDMIKNEFNTDQNFTYLLMNLINLKAEISIINDKFLDKNNNISDEIIDIIRNEIDILIKIVLNISKTYSNNNMINYISLN